MKKYFKNLIWDKKDYKQLENSLIEIINKKLASKEPILLLGSGQLGQKVYRGLTIKKIYPVAFIDNNEEKWGKKINDVIILSPKEAFKKYGKNAVIFITIWAPHHSFAKSKKQLKKIGFQSIFPFQILMWKLPKVLLPHYQFSTPQYLLSNLNDIKKASLLFKEKISINQYINQLNWRLTLNFDFLPKATYKDQYFTKNIVKLAKNEIFVDCGAFNGDTIKSFLHYSNKTFSQLIALEPDLKNFQSLSNYVNSLNPLVKKNILINNYAVSSKNMTVRFLESGAMQSTINKSGKNKVKSVTLDKLLFKNKPTFLKFDIEGYEMEALKGAKKIIAEYSPIITVCIYHKPNDFWKIPLFISSLNKNYKYFFRTHDEDGLELVLYAIPTWRLS